MFQSPFLDANPSYASVLTSAIPTRGIWPDGEYVYIVRPGRLGVRAYESKMVPANAGPIDYSQVPRPKVGYAKQSYIFLVFVTIYRQRWYRSFRKVPLPPQGGGGNFSKDYGSSLKNHRRDMGGKFEIPPGKYLPKGPRVPNLRPNPEVRTRTRQNFSEGNNGGYFFSPSLSVEQTYFRSWSGLRTPNFGSLPKNQRPVNPHSVLLEDVKDGGLIEMIDIPSTGIYFNQYSAFTRRYNPPVAPGHDAKAISKALKKLSERMENGMDSNLAQDIVQIRQTISLIADTAKRLAKTGLNLKNGNLPGAAMSLFGSKRGRYDRQKSRNPSNTKSAADNWLAMQYGWKPLLQDLHGSMEAIARMHLADASIKQASASAQVETWDVKDIPLPFNASKVAGWTRVQQVSRCKFGIRFTVDSHLIAFLAQTGFTNPINLLWEVLPFSFVWDWMQPIGPWLESFSNFHGLVFLDGYQSQFTKQKVESLVRFTGKDGAGPGQDLQTAGNYGRETVKFDRIKLSAFPTTSFPSFKNPLSVEHALNALALVKSVFHK
jgi:hypothetical protein